MPLEHPPPPYYNQPQIQYQRDYILQILHRGSMISGHWFTVSMYSALQWCHIRCIYRLKLCRQDILELLRGTVSSRRSFIQQQHSFISTVGRSITFCLTNRRLSLKLNGFGEKTTAKSICCGYLNESYH